MPSSNNIFRYSAFTLLSVAAVILAAVVVEFATAQQTIIPLDNPNPNNIKLSLSKGDVKVIDFFLLLSRSKKAYPGMVVSITSLPKRGKLYALPSTASQKPTSSTNQSVTSGMTSWKSTLKGSSSRRLRAQLLTTFTLPITPESVTKTSSSNMFLYVSSRNQTNPLVFDAYEDSFTYSVTDGNMVGGDAFDGQAAVSVFNNPPTVPGKKITKFVRTVVGSDSNWNQISIGDKNAKLQKKLASTRIPFNDKDIALCGSSEIQSVTIVDDGTGYLSGGNACTIKTLNGDKILTNGLVLANTELRVYATFNSDTPNENAVCQFNYRVKDSSGAVSKQLGTLEFKRQSITDSKKPIVYNRNYRYYPKKQSFIVISLSSFGDAQAAVKVRQQVEADGVAQRGARPTQTLPSTISEDEKSVLGKRTFYINRYPSVGQLYIVPKMSSLTADPSFLQKHLIARNKKSDDNVKDEPVQIFSGTSRRIHVLYKLDSAVSTPAQIESLMNTNDTFTWSVRSVDGIVSNPATVTVTFRDNNRYLPGKTWDGANPNATTPPRGLQCRNMDYSWVFWNRAVTKVNLNYSLPRGDPLSQIILLSNVGIPVQFGKLYQQSTKIFGVKNRTTTELKSSTEPIVFSDLRFPRFKFVPTSDVAKKLTANYTQGVTQVYKFKLVTKMGSTCVATLTFSLKKHVQKRKVKDASTGEISTRTIVFDTAPYGQYTLFALKGNRSTNVDYQYVRLVSGPRRGAMYLTNVDAMPYDPGMTNQDTLDPTSDQYCVRHSCEKYLIQPRARSGQFIRKNALFSRKGLSISADRFWVIYRAPSERSKTKENDFMDFKMDTRGDDTFEIQFCKDKSESSCDGEVLAYYLHLHEGNLRRIYVPFSKRTNTARASIDGEPPATLTFDDMTVVPITLGRSTETLVRILDFDPIARHGVPPEFRLYQAKRNGNARFNFGPALVDSNSEKYPGLSGKFIRTENSDENTILLVPNSGTRHQNFRFRARLYNRTILDGINNFSIDVRDREQRLLTLKAYEDVRVIAVRQNTPPVWNSTILDRDFGDVPLGKSVSWEFEAIDKDNDQLTFIVKKAPLHADLFLVYSVLGRVRSVKAYNGLRFTGPRGDTETHTYLNVEYRPKFEPKLIPTYPLNDTFTLYADDGSGVLSKPLQVRARVLPPLQGWTGQFSPEAVKKEQGLVTDAKSGSHLILILVISILVVVSGGILYFLRRRNLLRQQFSKLANITSTEMT